MAERTELERQSPLAIDVAGEPIALDRLGGAPFATLNTCTHARAQLTDGFLDGGCIECPIHQAQFDIRTDAVVSGPADMPLKTYACRLNGEAIEIDV